MTGVEALEEILHKAKWTQEATRKLVRVRRIEEGVTSTLDKVIQDWIDVHKIVLDMATPEERRRLDNGLSMPWKGTLPDVLKGILKRLGEGHA